MPILARDNFFALLYKKLILFFRVINVLECNNYLYSFFVHDVVAAFFVHDVVAVISLTARTEGALILT